MHAHGNILVIMWCHACCFHLQNFMYAAARFGEVKEVLLATFDGRS